MSTNIHMPKKLFVAIVMMAFIISPLSISHANDYHVIDITLETIYEDGEKGIEIRSEEIIAMEDFWGKYQAWQLVDMSKNEAVFRSRVKELSPLTTLSGYSEISP